MNTPFEPSASSTGDPRSQELLFGLRPGSWPTGSSTRPPGRGVPAEDRRDHGGCPSIPRWPRSSPRWVAADVLQLAREALSNVGRHATCRVSLYRRDHHAVLEVDDDGRGFDPETNSRDDGLTNVKSRTRELGGNVSIEIAPGKGTTIRVALSL